MFYREKRVVTCGSRLRRDFVPDYTATVLTRLEAAGAIDLGGLNMSEFAANPFGLHDMIGNVWEWCEDVYVGYEHPARPGDGLRGTERPKLQADRCQRGGGFSTRAASTRSAFRARFLQDSRDNDLGVRPAKALDP
jgi:formylglycine-generating enzyme required for sulfatase activity